MNKVFKSDSVTDGERFPTVKCNYSYTTIIKPASIDILPYKRQKVILEEANIATCNKRRVIFNLRPKHVPIFPRLQKGRNTF